MTALPDIETQLGPLIRREVTRALRAEAIFRDAPDPEPGPHHAHFEWAIVVALLDGLATLDDVRDLDASDFYLTSYGYVFAVVVTSLERGDVPTERQIAADLEAMRVARAEDVLSFLAGVRAKRLAGRRAWAPLATCIETVRRLAVRRRLAHRLQELAGLVLAGALHDADQVIADLRDQR